VQFCLFNFALKFDAVAETLQKILGATFDQASECLLCPECKWTHLGREYVGTLSTTVSGRTCQAWSSNYPHVPTFNERVGFNYPYGSHVAARNYCRNPVISAEGPWCYTTDPTAPWEACNVPYCGASNSYSTLNISSYVR